MKNQLKFKEKIQARWDSKIEKEKSKIPNTERARILKAMICGFLAGDGSVQIRKEKTFYHYQLDFFPDDKLMRDKYIQALEEIYNKTPSIRIRDNVFHVRKTSKTIVTDITKYSKFDTNNWTLPSNLLTCHEAKAAWINAFFSAEAYVNDKTIKVQTVNREGMCGISKLLDEFKIEHRKYEYQPKKENHSKVYIININKRSARRKYHDKIGFWHKKKASILKTALNL